MARPGRRAKEGRRPRPPDRPKRAEQPKRPEEPRHPGSPQPAKRPERPERVLSPWKVFGVLCALLAGMALLRIGPAGPRPVFRGDFAYYPEPADSSVVATPPFELTGRASSVEVAVSTDLDNAWVYFNYALIEQRTGRAIEFGREVGFYRGSGTQDRYDVKGGYHRDEYSWTEGSRDDAVRVPTVPAGRYVLRIAPEGPYPVRYGVRVRRDVPGWEFYAVAFLLLLIHPVLASLGRRSLIERVTAMSTPGGR